MPVPEVPAAGDNSGTGRAIPSDAAIMEKVYDTNYSVPDGFFIDERADTARSYTVHHVLDSSDSYELCTDDLSQAMTWETDDNAARSVNGVYVGSHENARYYEFIRELSYENDVGNIDDVTSPGFARVFKCSYANRDGVDRSLLSGFAGQLNIQPLAPDHVRDFAEYLWQFAFFPQRHKKVLASYAAEGFYGPGHALLLAFASSQGTGSCDLVEVVEWRFGIVDEMSRIHSEFRDLHSFEARMNDTAPELCQ